MPYEDQTPSYEPENAQEFHFEEPKPKFEPKSIDFRRILTAVAIAVVMIIILISAMIPKKLSPIEKRIQRLNELNTLDVPDIEACRRVEKRVKEKETILKEIRQYKKGEINLQ